MNFMQCWAVKHLLTALKHKHREFRMYAHILSYCQIDFRLAQMTRLANEIDDIRGAASFIIWKKWQKRKFRNLWNREMETILVWGIIP